MMQWTSLVKSVALAIDGKGKAKLHMTLQGPQGDVKVGGTFDVSECSPILEGRNVLVLAEGTWTKRDPNYFVGYSDGMSGNLDGMSGNLDATYTDGGTFALTVRPVGMPSVRVSLPIGETETSESDGTLHLVAIPEEEQKTSKRIAEAEATISRATEQIARAEKRAADARAFLASVQG
jgi:hypothetical protein